ncbi:MAG: aldehyde dehydrogenase family protein [Pirellulales bacterium]|nr:aldehyde dehydrogenase family protein [Pirellulales bacterium]
MNQILVNGRWTEATRVGEFAAFNPRTAEPLGELYPVSSWDDCDAALEAATRAADQLELVAPEQIANFLERYADRIRDTASKICAQAELETALPVSPRLLDVELPRTVDQLRQAASTARSEAWRNPICDAENNIHACFGPIGPVLVFGPNNFPLAFNSIAGGDFAAAIAAGNPVIGKAHSCHPGTSRLLAEQAHAAAMEAELPSGSVQMLYGVGRQDGLRMAADPRLSAAAFTGSRTAGLALKSAADAVGTPIYLEMSSVNPVFFLPGAVQERPEELASQMAGSCLLGRGQFCTCPNLFVLLRDSSAEGFLSLLKTRMEEGGSGPLLSKSTVDGLASAMAKLSEAGAELLLGGKTTDEPGYHYESTLWSVTGNQFLAQPEALQTEAFGPATLGVIAEDLEQLVAIADKIEGSLTASIYAATNGSDDTVRENLMRVMRRRAGRLLNDKMPTGVAVSPAMNHGGPFPATGHPGFTAVGLPASVRRFTKLDCYDNVCPSLLPRCLRDDAGSKG